MQNVKHGVVSYNITTDSRAKRQLYLPHQCFVRGALTSLGCSILQSGTTLNVTPDNIPGLDYHEGDSEQPERRRELHLVSVNDAMPDIFASVSHKPGMTPVEDYDYLMQGAPADFSGGVTASGSIQPLVTRSPKGHSAKCCRRASMTYSVTATQAMRMFPYTTNRRWRYQWA